MNALPPHLCQLRYQTKKLNFNLFINVSFCFKILAITKFKEDLRIINNNKK